MKLKIFTSLFAVFFVFLGVNFAQIDLDRIAREAQRNVNRRIEKNIDKSIDNAMDNAEDSLKKKKKKKNKRGEEIDYEPEVEVRVVKEVLPNSFMGKFMMNRSVEGNGSESSNMILVVIDDYRTALRPLIVKEPHNLIIFDKQEETVTTINNTNYEGKAMRDWYTYDTEEDAEYSTATKTSDIKEIDGYIARRYDVEGDGYSAIIWFTKEVDADLTAIYNLMEYDDLSLDKSLGFPLEMTVQYEDNRVEHLKVTGIAENEIDSNLFDISDYELIDMTDLKHGN